MICPRRRHFIVRIAGLCSDSIIPSGGAGPIEAGPSHAADIGSAFEPYIPNTEYINL